MTTPSKPAGGDGRTELDQRIRVGSGVLAETRLAQVDPMELIQVDEFGQGHARRTRWP